MSLRIGAVRGATFQIAYLLSANGEARATAVTVHGCVDGRGRPARLPGWVQGHRRRRNGTAAVRLSRLRAET